MTTKISNNGNKLTINLAKLPDYTLCLPEVLVELLAMICSTQGTGSQLTDTALSGDTLSVQLASARVEDTQPLSLYKINIGPNRP